jgi:hypothetical protein
MNGKRCVKGMYGAGNGSTKQEVDLIAAENGGGECINAKAGYTISGQTGYRINPLNTHSQTNWYESETSNLRPGKNNICIRSICTLVWL